jgi:hypothetical protein
MAFAPFFLAHSRVAHGDAPVAVFMSFSALTFFIFAQKAVNRSRPYASSRPSFGQLLGRSLTAPYLIASAVLGSLAALTKAPGQFMALFVVGLSLLYALAHYRRTNQPPPTAAGQVAPFVPLFWPAVVVSWGLISLVVFILLWPSMWIDPLGTFGQMWHETFGKVSEGHLVYYFGQPTLDPGFWFYPYVIPFRLTPVVLIGTILSLLLFLPALKDMPWLRGLVVPHSAGRNDSDSVQPPLIPAHILLWLFTMALLMFANLSPKKQDRYLLPLFPFLNLLAAIGWIGLVELIYHLFIRKFWVSMSGSPADDSNQTGPVGRPTLPAVVTSLVLLVLLLLHFVPVVTYYPYYLTYFNPLMGGPKQAAQTTLMGWGEGMEQVAAYLNAKPGAETLYVASTPSQTLLPYFAGTGENFYTNDIAFRADYVVLYLAQMQRLAPSPEIVHYFEGQEPEQTITIKEVTYAKIYAGPKLIRSDLPPDAVPANIGLGQLLRLAGYNLAGWPEAHNDPIAAGLNLTLYWHALAPITTNYTVSVRAIDAAGNVLAQQDQWPVDGLLPTSQWRQGDYVTDAHRLAISGADLARVRKLEVIVYNAEDGTTLGPPLTLNVGDSE